MILRISRLCTALIDDDDYYKVRKHVWRVQRYRKPRAGRIVIKRYIYTSVYVNGQQRLLFLTRLITNCPKDKRVRHINGRYNDCRKANLRVGQEDFIKKDPAEISIKELFHPLRRIPRGTYIPARNGPRTSGDVLRLSDEDYD